jgi:CRISPR-associated protein Cmr4
MNDRRQTSTAQALLGLLAETSVHAGTGAQLGAVDLPIQRERHTGWPTIYGSGLKGVLRDHAEATGQWSEAEVHAVFGPGTDKEGQAGGEKARHAGALALSDARILLFPVRTVGRAFAWITCPLALARLRRDVAAAGLAGADDLRLDATPTPDLVLAPAADRDQKILLEEFVYDVKANRGIEAIGRWIAAHLLPAEPAYAMWRDLAASALVVVADDEFGDFVRHGTEIVTRVRLGEAKTVETGALWSEENLPADSVLYSVAVAWNPVRNGSGLERADQVMAKVESLFASRRVVQVGGKETVGRGFVATRLSGGSHGTAA